MTDNTTPSTISITAEGPNEFTVRIGERYHDKMTWEEMLGQIAELTHPRISVARFWMLTADEWADRRFRDHARGCPNAE